MKVYMFHYVTKDFNYPHFDLDDFEKKIIELKKKYKIISLSDISNVNYQQENKERLLLSFDDGTKDHYLNVFPILKKHNIFGLFFLSSNINKREIFSIHYIHKLLSAVDINNLYNKIIELDEKTFVNFTVNNNSRYDSNIEYKVKRFLQEESNKKILMKLITFYNISNNYDDYYISIANIKEMKKYGMEFGLHTVNHKRLTKLSYEEQYSEIKKNYDFFTENNIFTNKKSLSFPFGEYNDDTLKISKMLEINYLFGINGVGDTHEDVIFRLDCNLLKELII